MIIAAIRTAAGWSSFEEKFHVAAQSLMMFPFGVGTSRAIGNARVPAEGFTEK